MAKLTYTDVSTVFLVGGGDSAGSARAYYYRMNDPYHPRGSTIEASTPGLSEYSTMYTRFRVIASSIKVIVKNPGNQSVIATIFPYYADTGTSFTPLTFQNSIMIDDSKAFSGNPYSKYVICNSSANDRDTTLYQYISMTKLTGDPAAATSELYAGRTDPAGGATPPQRLTYWAVTGGTYDELVSGQGTVMCVKITYWVEFFGRELELS